MASTIELIGLHKSYRDMEAVAGVSLTVPAGEFVTLLGPSGCGKSTIIRIVGGYIRPTKGQLLLDGVDIVDLPPQAREVGTVFQNYALFPHMTVFENVAFGLKVRKWKSQAMRDRVGELLELVQLGHAADLRPAQLSGGMQQRVALARALAFEPRILLMDEPLGALDVALREVMQRELKRIQRELGVTTIYVTHDQDEALFMSDRIAVMRAGRVEQYGTPQEIYHRPGTRFVSEFVGRLNLWPAEAGDGPGEYRIGGALVRGNVAEPVSGALLAGVRPERVRVTERQPHDKANAFSGSVAHLSFHGSADLLTVDVPALGGNVVVQDLSGRWRAGDQVWVSWETEDLITLGDEATGAEAAVALGMSN